MDYICISDGNVNGEVTDAMFEGTKCATLLLQRMGITTFPFFPKFAEKLWKLSLTGNNFRDDLVFSNFEQFQSLVILDLSSCSITSFPDVRSMGQKLKELYLGDNGISYINRTIMDEFKKLKSLDLSNNPLKEVNAEDFGTSALTLQWLNLRNTSLQSLDKQLFSSLRKLHTLDISQNSLSQTSALKDLPEGIQDLDLSNNRIVDIDLNNFAFIESAESVNLRNNPIRCVPTPQVGRSLF
jgi:Leucine-rich repeat (LRR) protein